MALPLPTPTSPASSSAAGPSHRGRRSATSAARATASARTCTSRCASTARPWIPWDTCSSSGDQEVPFLKVCPYSFRAASLARSWLAALSSPDGAGRSQGRPVVSSAKQPEIRKVAPAAFQIEAVADEELVRHGEADIPDGKILDQATIRSVEEGYCGERARLPQRQRLDEEVERHPHVHDVLDQEHVPTIDAQRQVLQQPHASSAAVALVA